MEAYIYYILSVIGLGWFISESSLLKSFRMKVSVFKTKAEKEKYTLKWFIDKFDGVINCIYCCSFWVGIGVYFLIEIKYNSIHSILSAFFGVRNNLYYKEYLS